MKTPKTAGTGRSGELQKQRTLNILQTTMINYSIVMRSVNANLLEINQAKSRINQAKKEGKTPQPAHLAQFLLLHEHEVDGGNEAEEGCKVVPVQTLTLEENVGNDGEDDEGYTFLYHLELNQ